MGEKLIYNWGLYVSLLLVTIVFIGSGSAAVAVIAPANYTNSSFNVVLNVTFTNGTDVADPANATFYYNGSAGWTTLASTTAGGACYPAKGSCWAITNLTDGRYNINATLFNATTSTNKSATQLVFQVTFDTTAPAVTAISPVLGQNVSGIIILNSTVTDATSLVSTVFYNITNITGTGLTNWSVTANNASANTYNATFNTANLLEGLYNITIYANDTVNNTNKSVVIPIRVDRTIPVTFPANLTVVAGQNVSGVWQINISVFDANSSIGGVMFNITNNLGVQNATIIASSAVAGIWNASINTTSLPDGMYNVTAYVNDTAGNANNTAAIGNITVDNTGPTVTLALHSQSQNSLEFTITTSDSLSGVTSQCTTNRSGATVSLGVATETGLECGLTYSYLVTCTDTAGASTQKSITLSTTGCDAGGSSSGGGSSGGSSGSTSTTTWTKTYFSNDSELSTKGTVTQSVESKAKVAVKINGENHYVGVISTTSNSATIEIGSTPQQVTLAIGESKMINFNGDNFYDLQITLTSITSGKANLEIKSVHSEIPAGTPSTTTSGSNTTSGSGSNASSTTSNTWTIAVIVIVVIILAAVAAYFFFNKKRRY